MPLPLASAATGYLLSVAPLICLKLFLLAFGADDCAANHLQERNPTAATDDTSAHTPFSLCCWSTQCASSSPASEVTSGLWESGVKEPQQQQEHAVLKARQSNLIYSSSIIIVIMKYYCRKVHVMLWNEALKGPHFWKEGRDWVLEVQVKFKHPSFPKCVSATRCWKNPDSKK